jgi:MFS transporter, PHS family, inorganic phosphate transporter
MIPAEIFPTRYRATCYGISAASGKLGSIIVQIFSTYYKFGTQGTSEIIRYGWILVVFAVVMLLGAGITYICIPSIQKNSEGRGKLWDGEPETLENLALGRMGPASRYATTINPGTSAVRNRNTLSPRAASFGDFQFDL